MVCEINCIYCGKRMNQMGTWLNDIGFGCSDCKGYRIFIPK